MGLREKKTCGVPKRLYPSFSPILCIFCPWWKNLNYVTPIDLVGVSTSPAFFLVNVPLPSWDLNCSSGELGLWNGVSIFIKNIICLESKNIICLESNRKQPQADVIGRESFPNTKLLKLGHMFHGQKTRIQSLMKSKSSRKENWRKYTLLDSNSCLKISF